MLRIASLFRRTSLAESMERFLASLVAGNRTQETLRSYRAVLEPFVRAVPDPTPLAAQGYLNGLRSRMQPISVHRHYRTLRAFFAWCVRADVLQKNPLDGFDMRLPKTLPRAPDDDAVRRLLDACRTSRKGLRNRALVALLADSGLRIGEALRLRVEDVDFGDRTLVVRCRKGQKDSVRFFGAETAQAVRDLLRDRPDLAPQDFLFVGRDGRSLSRSCGTHLLHRLSVRTGLARKVGPHALRHYAGRSLLNQTGDLELVRQALGHETLSMALRYAQLSKADVSRKFRRASPLDALRAGR